MKNLIDERGVTVALLAAPLEWRIRAVEEITVDAATHCHRKRSLQIAPLRPLLEPFVEPEDTEALIAFNVAPLPRGPLLDFSVKGPLGDAWLLPRIEIAQRQAEYLSSVAGEAGVQVTEMEKQVIVEVLAFPESLLAGSDPHDLQGYLEAALDTDITNESLEEWKAIGASCRTHLRPFLDEFKGYSVCENPALALPTLYGADQGFDEQVATNQLQAYLRLLRRLTTISNRDDDLAATPATEFLESLADYGNYYDLIVATKVPLDEPFLVKYSERRSFSMQSFAGIGQQDLIVRDARSNHVTFEVTDPSVRIVSFDAYRPNTRQVAYGSFLARNDEQTRSFYAHGADRDYRVRLVFRLALLRRLQLVPYLAAVLIVLLAAVLLVERTNDLKTLALVVGPSAFAASLLVAREPSTLGSRLRLGSTLLLSGALAVLIGSAAVSYICAAFLS